MTVSQVARLPGFETLCPGDAPDRAVTQPYCCDLLSFVIGRAPEGCAWVTVMGNVNAIAVASLADASCIVLSEGAALDAQALQKAIENGVCVFRCALSTFQAALAIHEAVSEAP